MNFDLGTGIAVLERTPEVLEALLSGIPDAWTTGNEGADTWSPFDVVGHLIDGETGLFSEAAQLNAQPTTPDRRTASGHDSPTSSVSRGGRYSFCRL